MKKHKKIEDFKYRSTFTAIANFKKDSFPPETFDSKASLDCLKELKQLAPASEEIKDNPDLLYTVFNIAVSNLVNLNGDAISNETALAFSKYFKHKPMNIEHSAHDVVGVITNVGFSSYPDNKVLSAEDLKETEEPFNIALAAIVWKHNKEYFADYLTATNDEESWDYEGISTSWEIAFDDYVIAKGSRNLNKAEIITDKKEIEKLSSCLSCFGGKGFDDQANEVYRVITGDVRPVGGGFVRNPAASVKGILVVEPEEDEEEKEEEEENDASAVSSASLTVEDTVKEEKIISEKDNNEKNISQNKKITVKNIKSMKFTSVDELYDCLAEASVKGESISPKDIRDLVKEQIAAADQRWSDQVSLKNKEAADLQIALDQAKASIAKLEELRQELDETKAAVKEQEDRNAFNERIAVLDEKYELSDKVRQVIAKNTLGKSDSEYQEWLSDEGDVILAGKEKKPATELVTPTQALELKSNASVETIPNATVVTNPSVEKSKSAQVATKDGSFVISLK